MERDEAKKELLAAGSQKSTPLASGSDQAPIGRPSLAEGWSHLIPKRRLMQTCLFVFFSSSANRGSPAPGMAISGHNVITSHTQKLTFLGLRWFECMRTRDHRFKGFRPVVLARLMLPCFCNASNQLRPGRRKSLGVCKIHLEVGRPAGRGPSCKSVGMHTPHHSRRGAFYFRQPDADFFFPVSISPVFQYRMALSARMYAFEMQVGRCTLPKASHNLKTASATFLFACTRCWLHAS